MHHLGRRRVDLRNVIEGSLVNIQVEIVTCRRAGAASRIRSTLGRASHRASIAPPLHCFHRQTIAGHLLPHSLRHGGEDLFGNRLSSARCLPSDAR
jgi:hypothetical protein